MSSAAVVVGALRVNNYSSNMGILTGAQFVDYLLSAYRNTVFCTVRTLCLAFVSPYIPSVLSVGHEYKQCKYKSDL